MDTSKLRINNKRLTDSIKKMAEIGSTAAGGCCRLAFTDEDRQAREIFIGWCQQAGLVCRKDSIGNIFCRLGADLDFPAVLIGSHLDTQPAGGKYDGVLGVLGGLEVVRILNENNVGIRRPLELCVWANEEGTRYTPAMMGSGVFAGFLDIDEMLALRDEDGFLLENELTKNNISGNSSCDDKAIDSYFELHIEQGPILEKHGKNIGVVTHGQGECWFDCRVIGSQDHAGATPMRYRKDPVAVVAEIILKIESIALNFNENAVATVGMISVSPNSRNTIAGHVDFTIDLRSPHSNFLDQLGKKVSKEIHEICKKRKLTYRLNEVWSIHPTVFSKDCVNNVRQSIKLLGYSAIEMISGAGHDAFYLARIASSAMIFIPSKNGISHAENEFSTDEDIGYGANVLLHSVLQRLIK